MDTLKVERLEQVTLTIQKKFGQQGIQTGRAIQTTNTPRSIATGYILLDEALGIGGLPRHDVTLIDGNPTAGMTTLVYRTIASAQKQGMVGVYLDLSRTFDADYALHQCGIDPDRFLLIYPSDIADGIAIVRDVLLLSYTGVVILDMAFEPVGSTYLELQTSLSRLAVSLKRSSWTLIGLLPQSNRWLSLSSSLHLTITRSAWQYAKNTLVGFHSTVLVKKNSRHPIGKLITISFLFEEEFS
jgi:recombination protein RecA